MMTPTRTAIAALRHSSARQPDSPDHLHQLGIALLAAGELDESIAAFRQSLALHPDFAPAWNNMGVGLKRAGRLDDAAAAFNHALLLHPEFADAHNNLGNLLCLQRRWDEAIESLNRAIRAQPDFGDAHGNLGNALFAKDDLDGAIACYHRAISFRPDSPGAYNNLANALCAKGDLPAALAACRAAIALQPDFADAHLSLGMMLLLQGDFSRGWLEYEWRWKSPDLGPPPVHFSQPRWDGSPLNGRRILLHAEQGLGDTLQFVRYIPLVAAGGGKILLACPPELASFLSQLNDVHVLPHGQPFPEFDVHCPLLSLPGIFQTTLKTIPASVPYLKADAAAAAHWRQRIPADCRLKIGLAWAGRSAHRMDRHRSFSPATLAPLGEIHNTMFISLQKESAAAQTGAIQACPFAMADWTDELHDFNQTAGLLASLDLVITADTAVAHLAGAMAKPVWVLLPFAPDWRWMLNRKDSPWYPTMRLFRQPRIGDWQTPIRQIAQALKDKCDQNPSQ